MSDLPSQEESRVPIKWQHYLLVLVFALLLTLLAPHGKSLEFSQVTIGSISPARVIAPFDFELLKSEENLETERSGARDAILPVLVYNDDIEDSTRLRLKVFGQSALTLLGSLSADWLSATIDSSEEYSGENGEKFLRGSKEVAERFKIHISGDQWRFLFRLYLNKKYRNGVSFNEFFDRVAPSVLTPIYANGVYRRLPNEANSNVHSATIRSGIEESVVSLDSLTETASLAGKLSLALTPYMSLIGRGSPEDVVAAAKLISNIALPNCIYDEEETARRKEVAVAMVPLAKGFVKRDELIIDNHIRVTPEHYEKLSSLAIKRAEQTAQIGGWKAWLPTFGHFTLAFVLSLFLWVSLAFARPMVWREWKLLLLIGSLLAIALLFYQLTPIRPEIARQLLPAAAVAMFLTIIFDRGVAALGVIALALSAGFIQGNDFQTAATAFGMGGTAIISIRSLNSRTSVLKSGLYIGAVAALISSGFFLANYSSNDTFLTELLAAVANGIFSPMLVIGIMPLVEGLFGISTDLTLLELVDLNRPLLRELALKSPGTYHHSLMVGSLAEAAAREVGANPILTRAGAYYHDIGKIENKEYFIENQETGSRNIHDRLPPTKSAEIVIGHVTHGLELAAKHKLPPKVTAFITEHHGQTKLAFFHAKAQRELGGTVDENRFRYPGPKPASKETGILMLADVVEAATRSLDHPTSAELRETVDRLVSTRLSEGDLDNCPLTLPEIQRIKDSFIRVLMGMHHSRVPYPGKIVDNGESQTLAQGPTERNV